MISKAALESAEECSGPWQQRRCLEMGHTKEDVGLHGRAQCCQVKWGSRPGAAQQEMPAYVNLLALADLAIS